MPSDETVIPPVRAGKIESSIEFEYDRSFGDGGFEAAGEHVWTFDLGAYADCTGLDIGSDYPHVAQHNGHALRCYTEYRWNAENQQLFVETKGVRGTTSWDYYFTRCGYYRLDDDLTVTSSREERQPYRQRTSENTIPHYGPYDIDGVTVEGGEELVRGLHHGRFGPPVEDRLRQLLVHDSPDDAVPLTGGEVPSHLYPNTEGDQGTIAAD